MMRFILGANSFAHKALTRRMNSPLHQAQLPDLGSFATEDRTDHPDAGFRAASAAKHTQRGRTARWLERQTSEPPGRLTFTPPENG